jgi:two-component system, NtrC family, sensor kinase
VPNPAVAQKLNRQSIAWRLALALGAVLILIGVVSVSCLWALFDIHHRLHALKQEEDEARNVVRLASAVRDQYAHVAHTIIIGNESHAGLFREATQHLNALVIQVRKQPRSQGAPGIDQIVQASREIESLFKTRILPAIRTGDRGSLGARHERILALAMGAQEQAEALARHAEASMEDLNLHVRATQHGAILFTVVAHLVALATAVLIGVYLYRTIARPIASLSAAASRVGAGDLKTRITVERDDELGRLSRRFNEMTAAVKEHQDKLLQSERLMGLASMSAGIAHELNNPIGVILGYAKLLRRRGDTGDPKVLAAIEEEAERCRQVIEGLLELTRGGVLNTAPVNIRAVVEDIVGALRVKGSPVGVAIDVHGRGTAEGDEARLRQVLTNLIVNALEACGTSGRVVILIDESQTGLASVEIHDTGGGLGPAARERIFEPFFTTKPTGSGLGLAIARAIARAHGGEIVVVSSTDRGTIFRLTIPATKREATA